MDKSLIKIWNESSKGIPFDKDPSYYAIEQEKLFHQNSLVVDLGGGQGDDAIYFVKRGHKVTIIDISDAALKNAKRKFKEKKLDVNLLKTIQCDLSEGEIPLEDEIADVVYARLSLHYFPRDITVHLFTEIFRVLKMNGIAFITLKSSKDEEEMSFLKKSTNEIAPGIFQEKDGQIKSRYTMKQLEAMLSEAKALHHVTKIGDYVEKFAGRKDRVKSGKNELILTEIILEKRIAVE